MFNQDSFDLTFSWFLTGILITNEAHGEVNKCTISGGNYGVGFSLKGSGEIKDCEIRNVNAGFSIFMNLKGKVTLNNNSITKSA